MRSKLTPYIAEIVKIMQKTAVTPTGVIIPKTNRIKIAVPKKTAKRIMVRLILTAAYLP